MPLIPENLNPYAQRVAACFSRHFPAWTNLIRCNPDPTVDEGSLLVEVPVPSLNMDNGLFIGTDYGQLTIGLHTHHVHFADWEQCGDDQHIDEGMRYIEAFINEEYVVQSWYSEGELCSSVAAERGIVYRPSLVRRQVDRITCRSWRGTYDSDDAKITEE